MSDSSTTRESMAVARLQAVGPSRWDVASMRWQSTALRQLTLALIAGVTGGLGHYVEAAKRAGIVPLQPLQEVHADERGSILDTIQLLSAPVPCDAKAPDMRPLFSRLAEWALCAHNCDALATRLQYQDLRAVTDAWGITDEGVPVAWGQWGSGTRSTKQFKFASYVVTSLITACQSAAVEYADDDGDPSLCLAYLEDDAARKAYETALRREWHQLHNSKYEHTSHLANKRAVAMQKENARLHRVPSKRRR